MSGNHPAVRMLARQPGQLRDIDFTGIVLVGAVVDMEQHRLAGGHSGLQHRASLLQTTLFILQGDPEFDSDRALGQTAGELLPPIGQLGIQVHLIINPAGVFPGLFSGVVVGPAQVFRGGERAAAGAPANHIGDQLRANAVLPGFPHQQRALLGHLLIAGRKMHM